MIKKIKFLFFLVFILFTQIIFSYEIKDSDGKIIHLKKTFKRIISLYPAHTEILYDLGAINNIVGTSKGEYINPKSIKDIPYFSYKDNIEKFILAKPDLVLIRPMIKSRYSALISSLEKSGITVISLQPKSSEELFDYWKTLGKLSGKTEEAEVYINSFKLKLDKIRKKVENIPINKRKTIFFEARFKRGLFTCSKNSMSYFILKNIGVNNIFKYAKPKLNSSFISPVERELLMSKGNSIDYYISQYGVMNRRKEKDIENTPGFKTIKAVRKKKIYVIDEMKISRPTDNLINTMQEIGELIYPEYFQIKTRTN